MLPLPDDVAHRRAEALVEGPACDEARRRRRRGVRHRDRHRAARGAEVARCVARPGLERVHAVRCRGRVPGHRVGRRRVLGAERGAVEQELDAGHPDVVGRGGGHGHAARDDRAGSGSGHGRARRRRIGSRGRCGCGRRLRGLISGRVAREYGVAVGRAGAAAGVLIARSGGRGDQRAVAEDLVAGHSDVVGACIPRHVHLARGDRLRRDVSRHRRSA